MPTSYLFIIISGFLLTSFLILILQKLAIKYHFLTSGSIPLIGGIAMGFAFLLICLYVFTVNGGLSQGIIGILSASLIMLIFGVIDDWWELSVVAKLAVQLICVSILILFGIKTQIAYIGNLLNIIITYIWIIGIANAFNHLDTMDGLAAGTALIISMAFFTTAFLNKDFKTTIFFLTLGVTVFSFLIYNFPPAKIYLGNSGSHFLGFVLAAVAIMISYAPLERKIALLSPLLILGFPIFDTTFLVLMRITQGRSAFQKSEDHLAKRFLKIGYSKNKVLIFMLSFCFLFSFCGIIVSQASNPLGITTILLVLVVGLAVTIKMGRVSLNG